MGNKKKRSRNYGHKKGLIAVGNIINAAIKKKINFLTLFIFSTENWKRPANEVSYLFKLLEDYIDKEINNLLKKKIKIKVIGNIKPFPKILKLKIKNVEKLTSRNKNIQINMALNYGSREEIINTFRILNRKNLKINAKNFEKFLYTSGIPDPDILIRTGNTNRISNFLIWQLIYTEIFFLNKMWPDFTKKDFFKIINKFKKINRNFGGLNDRGI